MTLIDTAQRLVYSARAAVDDDAVARAELDRCMDRLSAPLRVALAGSLKAGKSTMLNALVGQDIAPTDATECTRVVTWYRRGRAATVTAVRYDGGAQQVPVTRYNGRLSFDLGALGAEDIAHLDVTWPSAALDSMTIVDTPGTASLTRELSMATEELLAPTSRESGVDAVVYLMRAMTAEDTAMLRRIGEALGGDAGPLGIVGVVSRADEIGAGRIDAMSSARQTAGRIAGELSRTGLCQAVVPVAGLLALAARTMQEIEFRGLLRLASMPPETLDDLLLSVDRFVATPIDGVAPEVTAALADRFGVFGIRMAVTAIRFGAGTASELAAELIARSGLDELHDAIASQIADRADQLKAHSALVATERILSASRSPRVAGVLADVRRSLADTHGFSELALLGKLRSGQVAMTDERCAELSRLIGGSGVQPWARLGLHPQSPSGEVRQSALRAVSTWRDRMRHPLADAEVSAAALVGVRSAAGIIAELDGG
ncbi:Isoniazid-inducible protein iniC [Gordonia sp. TBRC 11910]|uniref:Isoniazid-inducible protein iniC n=1 Tax=Gordonia asplenii TaxID=2725283 RepID=A0A848L279_9ACTN|nr:dynamin family protein [Gordonia asplenii]NMO02713.1 Isoniazid-inducible protein iniC [Gordonia asplenii]